jgi:hypothetical protein
VLKRQEMQENFNNIEKFINECDKKFFASFKKQKNPMDAVEQSILAAELGLAEVQGKIQEKNDKKKGFYFFCFEFTHFFGFFKNVTFFIADRTTDRATKQTSAATASSTTTSSSAHLFNPLKRSHHTMQQNNYDAYQHHMPNKSYYNVRATPHLAQGGAARPQDTEQTQPREIPLEPQINFQISLAPPMAAEFDFIALMMKNLSRKLTARKIPFEVYAPCIKEVLDAANESYEKHVKNSTTNVVSYQ